MLFRSGDVVVGDIVLTDNIRGNGASQVTIDDHLKVTGNTTLEGNLNIGINNLVCGDLTANGIYGTAAVQIQNMISAAAINANNPFFCAGRVDGATSSPVSSLGRVGYTVVRPSGQATGIWNIVFNSPAPNNNYVVSLTNMNFGTIYLWDQSPPTVNGFTAVIVNNTWSLRNAPFQFRVSV